MPETYVSRARSGDSLGEKDYFRGGREDGEEEKGRLFFASVSRKRAEQDALLLQNRIKLLLAEQAKADKKIEEAHTKIEDITKSRQRADSERQKRLATEEHRDRFAQDQSVKNAQLRLGLRKRLMEARGKAELRAHDLASERRVEKEKIQEDILDSRVEEEQYNRRLFEEAQKRKAQRRSARQANLEETKARAKLQFENKVEYETRQREERERQIEKMEADEVALIQRLQNTQQKQKEIYDKLAEVMQQRDVMTPRQKTGRSVISVDHVELYAREKDSRKGLESSPVTECSETISRASTSVKDKPSSSSTPTSKANRPRIKTAHDVTQKATADRRLLSRKKETAAQNVTQKATADDCAASSEDLAEKTYTTVDGRSIKIQPLQQGKENGEEFELELASMLNLGLD